MLEKIKTNYNHTIYACYLAYIVQAIINAFIEDENALKELGI